MSMFGAKMGTWIVSSKEDPKWNKSGRAKGLCCEGGPEEAQEWIKQCKAKFGEQPKDLEISFWKD
jgi:hypothetical protein